MLFDRIDQDWAAMSEKWGAELAALVVDDEEVIREVVGDVLEDTGFAVESAESAEQGWELLRRNPYDLVVVDKNLPGETGLDLINRMQDAEITTPVVMITGFPSVESISKAISGGAADYIAKPFDDVAHVARRLKSVVDQSLSEHLYRRTIQDLTEALAGETQDQATVSEIGRELFQFKKELKERTQVLLVEPSDGIAETVEGVLSLAGMTSARARDADEARAALSGERAPLTVVLSLKLEEPLSLLEELRRQDPLAEVLVASTASDLDAALGAVTRGAADYVDRAEGTAALEARARRLLARSRRQRLNVHLIATLYRRAREIGHPVADRLREGLPEEQRAYLDAAAGVDPSSLPAVDVDLADLFDAEDDAVTRADRRAHPRLPFQVTVRVRPLDNGAEVEEHQTRDVSVGGAFIKGTRSRAVGQQLQLEFDDGDSGRPVIAVGEVVRLVRISPDPEGISGAGVRVVDPSASGYREFVEKLTRSDD